MNFKRLKMLTIIYSRLKVMAFFLKQGKFREVYNYLWVHAFTKDSGLALLDPLLKIFPSLAPYPQQIEVEITTRCHLQCTICEHTYWNEPSADMSLEQFKNILNQFPGLKWLGLTGIGSNMLNKDFFEMLAYAKSRHIYTEFFDTFDLINEENAEKLIRLGVEKIWMSIDGATKPTYDRIRVGTTFEKVTGNARKLMELKKKLGSPVPEIWFHYIINKDNYKELPLFVELVAGIVSNGTNPATMIYFTNLLSFDEVKDMAAELPKDIIDATYRAAKKHGIYLGWNPNIKPVKPITECTRWTEPFILSTGHIQSCCAINEANTRAYQKEHALANLNETHFSKIWKKEYKNLVRDIHNNKLPAICKHCRVFLHD